MRGARGSHEQREVAARRLAQLSAELAVVREVDGPREPDGGLRPESSRDADVIEMWSAEDRPPALPGGGRHAHRRARGARLPGWMAERVAVGPAQAAVVGVIVLAGLLLTGWWTLRSGPEAVPVITEPPAAVAPASTQAATATATAAAEPGRIVVDVAGKVRQPGIAVLEPGDRVVDALRAAGGARPGVDLAGLNLARVLVDGEQILVGVPAPGGIAASAASTPGAASGGPLVNLNLAGQAELETLPEVGPVTAQAIIAWREQHGAFTAVDQLLDVDGIGEATLAQLAPLVTV